MQFSSLGSGGTSVVSGTTVATVGQNGVVQAVTGMTSSSVIVLTAASAVTNAAGTDLAYTVGCASGTFQISIRGTLFADATFYYMAVL